METPSSGQRRNAFGGPIGLDVPGACGERPVQERDQIGPVCCGGSHRLTCQRGRLPRRTDHQATRSERPHELSGSCWCAPVCEPVERPDGSFSWLYLHLSPVAGSEAYFAAVEAGRKALRELAVPAEGSVLPPDPEDE